MRYYVLFVMVALVCFCADARGRFTNHSEEVEGGYNFILYEPEGGDAPLPLIVSLHSRGASGHNLENVDNFGTIDALHSGLELDAVVLAPQTDNDRWDADKVMKDIDHVLSNYNIDPNRVYAIGMSMGGNGVASLAAKYPDRIAAAMILAGALADGEVANLNKVPLWVIRGTDDRARAIERTDGMVKAMRAQPDKAPRLVYTKIKGLDHRGHERILYMRDFYDWLMSHRLDNPNRPVNKTTDIRAQDLKDAYQGLELREKSAARRPSRDQSRERGPRRR